jgi:hypothetical protein
MAGSSFVRMSDEQVLPLQYFNIAFVSKGLIERLAHTEREVKKSHCDAAGGPCAEALALVLPDSELPAF